MSKYKIERHVHDWKESVHRLRRLPFNIELHYKEQRCYDCGKRKIVK